MKEVFNISHLILTPYCTLRCNTCLPYERPALCHSKQCSLFSQLEDSFYCNSTKLQKEHGSTGKADFLFSSLKLAPQGSTLAWGSGRAVADVSKKSSFSNLEHTLCVVIRLLYFSYYSLLWFLFFTWDHSAVKGFYRLWWLWPVPYYMHYVSDIYWVYS